MTLPTPKITTHSGVLTDFEGSTAHIDHNPLTMVPAAANWCREKLKKGMEVEFEIFEEGEDKDKIRRIWEKKPAQPQKSGGVTDIAGDAVEQATAEAEKRKAAGFGQSTEGPDPKPKTTAQPPEGGQNQNCTSPVTLPAAQSNGLKKVTGQIIIINPEKRGFAVKDVDGVVHPFYWRPGMDSEFSRLKQWWFASVTAEQAGENWIAIAQIKADKPEGWKGGFGGRGGQPRNERLIAAECLLKAYIDLHIASHTPDSVDFQTAREAIKAAVKADLPWLMKIGGA